MNYTSKIQKAIKFAAKTHDLYQKQMRKGKNIAYITHPLTVGIILALAGSPEDEPIHPRSAPLAHLARTVSCCLK